MSYEQILKLYQQMVFIRELEEMLYALFSKGVLFGTTHACIGQEAIAVGVIANLDIENDIITSNHRGHGHFLAYSQKAEGLLAEIMGKVTGVCHGWGGSQHLCYRNFYSNGVLGSLVPVGVGMAYAEKTKGTQAIVCNFLGDGTLGEGVVYEAINMAALWKLPVIFCIENNRYQQATPVEKAVAGSLVERGRAFGLETASFDGNNVVNIYEKFGEIVDRVRKDSVPYWVVFDTYRLGGHSKSDDLCYRDRREEEKWRKRDPITLIERHIDEQDRTRILEYISNEITKCYERAQKAEFPVFPTESAL